MFLAGAIALAATQTAEAQSPADSSRAEPLTIPAPSIGFLMQVDGYAESQLLEPGFAVRVSRLIVAGDLSSRFSYYVQANLITKPALLDTRLRFWFTEAVLLEAGLVKAPFSAEFLTFRGYQPLAEPSRLVLALAPKRQIGATMIANLGSTTLQGGLYNGNGRFDLANDGAGFMTVGRVEHRFPFDQERQGGAFRIGLNGVFSRDHAALIPGLYSAFAGDRLAVGADAELRTSRLFASGELNLGWFRPDEGMMPETAAAEVEPDIDPWGYVLTAGYTIARKHQILGRVDYFDTDRTNEASVWLIASYSFRPLPSARFVIEYRYDATNRRTNTVVGRFQISRK